MDTIAPPETAGRTDAVSLTTPEKPFTLVRVRFSRISSPGRVVTLPQKQSNDAMKSGNTVNCRPYFRSPLQILKGRIEVAYQKFGQSWSELTGSQEAEELRERIYSLYVKGFNIREIAKTVGLPKSNVAYHLGIIRKQNITWFDKNVDPEGRRRAFTKELIDQIGETVRESWMLYGRALIHLNHVLETDKSPVAAFGVCNSYIRTIISSLQQYRLSGQVVAPSMDDVWLKEMLDTVRSEAEEIRMKMKVRGFPAESLCWEYAGTKFIYILDRQREDRSAGGRVPSQGSDGADSAASMVPTFQCIIIPSLSTQPKRYERWTNLAGYGLQASSVGKFLPPQVSGVTFPMKCRYALKPPPEYIKSRIRKGFGLYLRARSLANELEAGLVTALANASSGADAHYQPLYHPISDDSITFELQSMERNEEVHIEGLKVRLLK